MFFDESRFGTHSKLGHGWFKKGTRTPIKVKLGFKNFYLYSAVAPLSGKDFTLLLPEVNTNCMNLFLKELEAYYEGKDILLVMDCAGWHKSKGLKLPSSIQPIYLAPYSPELNPVERFWQYIKRHTIKNKLYETLYDLEISVCNFLKELKTQEVRDICAVNYLYN